MLDLRFALETLYQPNPSLNLGKVSDKKDRAMYTIQAKDISILAFQTLRAQECQTFGKNFKNCGHTDKQNST